MSVFPKGQRVQRRNDPLRQLRARILWDRVIRFRSVQLCAEVAKKAGLTIGMLQQAALDLEATGRARVVVTEGACYVVRTALDKVAGSA